MAKLLPFFDLVFRTNTMFFLLFFYIKWLVLKADNTSNSWHSSLIFSEKRIGHFMQSVSRGDSLHEMSNSVFWGKQEKYFSK